MRPGTYRDAAMAANDTLELFRPVGQRELELIRDSGWSRFPPRQPSQPFFYPVLTKDYAASIARNWNTKDLDSGYTGYVLRFKVIKDYIDRYEIHQVGGSKCREYWIPAEELDEFNNNIVGTIEVIQRFVPH